MATRKIRLAILISLFAIGLFLRTAGLGLNGLSEDEANKILATEGYRKGNFTPNAEHPMLLKVASLAVLLFAEKWNSLVPSVPISPEAALRFPVALGGAATCFAIYLLGRELFSPTVALIASALWAVDVNTVALSRIAKEDALATLFFVFANYFLLRAKRLHWDDPLSAKRSYLATGASFGLMFASKYIVPYPWITLIYYDIFRFRQKPRWRIDRQTLFQIYGCLLGCFLLLNPIVLLPQVWKYNWLQFTHQRLTHIGYVMRGEIVMNKAFYTFWGQPFDYYALYLFVKTPIPLLIALGIGLTYTLRKFRDDRFLFLGMYFVLWLFLLSLPGGKFTRYAITLMPAVVLLEALGIYIAYSATASFLNRRGIKSSFAVLAAMLIGIAGWELFLNYQYFPIPSLYISKQGGGEQRLGYYFPQDDFYDAGLREAIEFLSRKAPTGSIVLGSTPAAFQYYQMRYSRPDLEYVVLPTERNHFPAGKNYFLLFQDYRQYLETSYILTFAYAELNPVFNFYVKGKNSVILYDLSREAPFAKGAFWRTRKWTGLLLPLSQAAN